jgi:hypothetical protein
VARRQPSPTPPTTWCSPLRSRRPSTDTRARTTAGQCPPNNGRVSGSPWHADGDQRAGRAARRAPRRSDGALAATTTTGLGTVRQDQADLFAARPGRARARDAAAHPRRGTPRHRPVPGQARLRPPAARRDRRSGRGAPPSRADAQGRPGIDRPPGRHGHHQPGTGARRRGRRRRRPPGAGALRRYPSPHTGRSILTPTWRDVGSRSR